MQDDLIAASRVKLEVFYINDRGEEVSKLSLESRPTPGGGDGGIHYQTTVEDDTNARTVIMQTTRWLATISEFMPPGSMGSSPAAGVENPNDLYLPHTPAGEGSHYVKNALPYGEHMAMVNTEIERDSHNRITKIGGQMEFFRKVKSDSSPGQTDYLIKDKKEWKKIKNIDKYIKKHKVVIHKVLPDRDEPSD